jgi:hypothetical protein
VNDLYVGAAAESLERILHVHDVAEQDDGVTLVLEPLRRDVLRLLDEADDGDGGCRVDRTSRTLIVE